MNQLRRYYYVDRVGINTLFNQISEYTDTEIKTTNKDKKSESLSSKLGLGILLGVFNPKIESDRKKILDRESIVEKFSTKEVEQKIKDIEKYLDKNEQLSIIKSNNEIATFLPESLPKFIKADLEFRLDPQYLLDPFRTVLKNEFISLEVFDDSESTRFWKKIMMGGSLSKFYGSSKGKDGKYAIGYTSHLAIAIRNMASKMRLNVFGYLEQTGANLYIKPFSIWT